MRIYISGPMSGLPHFNIHSFDAVARLLRSWGNEVVSPAELDDPAFRDLCLACASGTTEELACLCAEAGVESATWGELLARDTKLLADDGIECIVVLDGWNASRGAVLETLVARLCDIPVAKIEGNHLSYLSPAVLRAVHAEAAGRIHELNRRPHPFATESCERLKLVEEGRDAYPGSPELGSGRLAHELWAEEVRITSETGGQKGSKEAVIGDICPKALMQVARVAGMGRRKYDRLNYLKGFDWSLSYDAAQRHLMLFWSGEDTDEESGLPHLAHAAWQCLCLLAFSIRDLGKDDRP